MTKTTARPQGDTTSEEAKVIDYLQKNPETADVLPGGIYSLIDPTPWW